MHARNMQGILAVCLEAKLLRAPRIPPAPRKNFLSWLLWPPKPRHGLILKTFFGSVFFDFFRNPHFSTFFGSWAPKTTKNRPKSTPKSTKKRYSDGPVFCICF